MLYLGTTFIDFTTFVHYYTHALCGFFWMYGKSHMLYLIMIFLLLFHFYQSFLLLSIYLLSSFFPLSVIFFLATWKHYFPLLFLSTKDILSIILNSSLFLFLHFVLWFNKISIFAYLTQLHGTFVFLFLTQLHG